MYTHRETGTLLKPILTGNQYTIRAQLIVNPVCHAAALMQVGNVGPGARPQYITLAQNAKRKAKVTVSSLITHSAQTEKDKR